MLVHANVFSWEKPTYLYIPIMYVVEDYRNFALIYSIAVGLLNRFGPWKLEVKLKIPTSSVLCMCTYYAYVNQIPSKMITKLPKSNPVSVDMLLHYGIAKPCCTIKMS